VSIYESKCGCDFFGGPFALNRNRIKKQLDTGPAVMDAVDYIMNGRPRFAGQYPYPLRIDRQRFFIFIIEKTFSAKFFYHLLVGQLKRTDTGWDKLIND